MSTAGSVYDMLNKLAVPHHAVIRQFEDAYLLTWDMTYDIKSDKEAHKGWPHIVMCHVDHNNYSYRFEHAIKKLQRDAPYRPKVTQHQ